MFVTYLSRPQCNYRGGMDSCDFLVIKARTALLCLLACFALLTIAYFWNTLLRPFPLGQKRSS